ncbi:MAG: response regulator transcription factor [Herpetosiphon sp.]
MEEITVLLVDDHAVVRQGLRLFLATQQDIRVIAEAGDGPTAIAAVARFQPAVVLMDLKLPGIDGTVATRQIKARFPETEVIVLTSYVEEGGVTAAIQAGAIGYLLKDVQPAELVEAIRAAVRGEVHLHPAAARYLMHTAVPDPEGVAPEQLTERERSVLRALARGQSNRAIADGLVVSEKTIKAHVSNILSKLGLESRTQAVLYALRHGIASLDESSL